MPPSQLEGRVDRPVPAFDHDTLLARLQFHTDVLSAHVAIHKAKYQLQSARVVPLPDVDVRVLTQKDYTAPPNHVAHSFVMSIPVPVWDQNRGGVRQAEWALAQASRAEPGPQCPGRDAGGSL